MLPICLCLLALAFVMSLAACRALVHFSPRLGHVDRPGTEQHKAHARIVPNTGGLALVIAIAPAMAVGLAVAWLWPEDSHGSGLGELARSLRDQTPAALAVLAAVLAMHVLGLFDDRRGLAIWIKFVVEFAVAGALATFFDMRVFEFLTFFGPAGIAACLILSTLWLVAITNAMNMLDNMDGLAAGVGAIVAVLYLAATLIGGQWVVAATCALLAGSLGGFLVFNFPPARLFMGDAGSLVLGLLLAVISVRTTYINMPTPQPPSVWYAALMPLVILAVPLYDLASVTLIRLSAGRSPFAADHNHLSHRLVRMGLSRRAAVLVIWLTTAATGIGGIMLSTLAPWQAILVAVQTATVLAVLAALEWKRGG